MIHAVRRDIKYRATLSSLPYLHASTYVSNHYVCQLLRRMSQRLQRKVERMSRNWIFTLNNYTPEEEQQLDIDLRDPSKTILGVVGREVGERGTPHLQGYVELRKRCSRVALQETLQALKRAHLEFRRGRRDQAIKYCKKENDFKVYGEIPNEKESEEKLTNSEIREIAMYGGSRAVARDERATLHQIKFARLLLEEMEPQRDAENEITVYWYYGATGIGKSRRARWEALTEYGEDEVYRKAEPSKWFNGYDRHKAVIIDDYRDSWWIFTEVLRLLDRYPTQVEVKGGMRQWVPEKIWVTSAHSPRELYKGVGEDIQQLVRRCTIIEEMVFKWEPPVE